MRDRPTIAALGTVENVLCRISRGSDRRTSRAGFKDIRVPDEILGRLQKFLLNDRSQQEALNKEQQECYCRQLAASYPPHGFGLPG